MNLTLNPGQEAAVKTLTAFLAHPRKRFMRLIGHAGTGKTTVLNHTLENIEGVLRAVALLKNQKYVPLQVHKTATTHKAAALLDDAEGTIQSLMGCRVVKDYKTGKTNLEQYRAPQVGNGSLIVVDEGSYIGSGFLKIIMQEAERHNLKVLFLLDKDQLSPIEESTGSTIPVMHIEDCVEAQLTEIMRHGGAIADAAGQYREAVTSQVFPIIPHVPGEVERMDGQTFRNKVDEIFSARESACILAYHNIRVDQYNEHVRREVMGFTSNHYEEGEEVILGNFLPNVGRNEERFIIKGHYPAQVSVPGNIVQKINGVRYKSMSLSTGDIQHLFVPDNPSLVSATYRQLNKEKRYREKFELEEKIAQLRLPYACTVHKSQGSTFDYVFVDLVDIGKNWEAEQVARLLYVAISRARKQVFLYGDLPAKYRG